MALKIRLARGGTKKRPFYRIVIAEASSPRDGRFVERIGSYNPMLPTGHENRLVLDGERAKYWMSKGAKPTLRVHKMMAGIGLLDSPEIREQPKKSAFGKKRQEREDAAAEAAEAAAAEAAEVAEAAAAAPAEEAAAEEAPAEEAAAEEAPAEEAAAEEVPAEEAPAEEVPAEEAPAEDKAE
jgi:small subunit ribosomal protein S16